MMEQIIDLYNGNSKEYNDQINYTNNFVFKIISNKKLIII